MRFCNFCFVIVHVEIPRPLLWLSRKSAVLLYFLFSSKRISAELNYEEHCKVQSLSLKIESPSCFLNLIMKRLSADKTRSQNVQYFW